MKKYIVILSIIFVLFLGYVGWYRISLSNLYKLGFINNNVMTGNYLEKKIYPLISGQGTNESNQHNFIETIVVPVSGSDDFTLNITGGAVFIVFAGYSVFGYKEYKPISFIEYGSGEFEKFSGNTLKIYPTGRMFYSTEVGYHFVRNSFFDKGGRLSEIIIQIMTNSSGNIGVIKTNE